MKHWKAHPEAAATRPPKVRGPGVRARVSGLGGELERWARVDAFEPSKSAARHADRSGALVGLIIVAAACAGLCFTLYQVSGGARDTFAEAEGPID